MDARMVRRCTTFVRKGGPHAVPSAPGLDAHTDALIASLARHLRTKREFEDATETSEACEAFAERAALPAGERALLLSSQARKDIFVPNPWLDAFITAVFLAEVVLVSQSLSVQGRLGQFLLFLVLADALIGRAKHLSTVLGQRLAAWLADQGFVDADPLLGRVQLKKWTESSWQLAVHVVFTAAEARVLWSEPWLERPETVWQPHPYVQMHDGFRDDINYIYVASLAVWVYTCIVHRFVDERRKDYFVMYAHHVVTIALVGGSWSTQYLRVGLLVMFVHDVSDICVDLLKLANYLKLEGRRGLFASEIAYAATIVSWAYWRLYIYPFRVIRSSFVYSFEILAPLPRVDDGPWGLFPPDLPLWGEMNLLLVILLVMHCWWFYLLLMIGWRIAFESTREASRKEYEGYSDDEGEVEEEDEEGEEEAVGAVEGGDNAASAGSITPRGTSAAASRAAKRKSPSGSLDSSPSSRGDAGVASAASLASTAVSVPLPNGESPTITASSSAASRKRTAGDANGASTASPTRGAPSPSPTRAL